MPGRAADRKPLIFFFPLIYILPVRDRRLLPLIPFNHGHQMFLFIIAKNNIRNSFLSHIRARRLHITAGSDNHGLRILPPRTVQHLPGFTVCNIRHGTRINHIYIRLFMKCYNFIACCF